jgi:hypothetical protein
VREEVTFSNRAHDDDDRRDCLPIQIRNISVCGSFSAVCLFSCTRVTTSYDRENVRAPPRPPFVAHAPHDRERVSLARFSDARRASSVPGRARLGVSRVTDHPNGCVQRDYARAEDLTRRDHGAGPHAGEAGASRRHASALVSRAPARPAPRPRARARRAARPPPRRRLERVSNASRTRLERASSLLTSRGGPRLSSLLRRRIESTIDHHDADVTTLTFMNDVSNSRVRFLSRPDRFCSATWARASPAWCFAS